MHDFRALAACRELEPELFFPVGTPGAPLYDAQLEQAQAVCAKCPVLESCAWFALDNPDMTEFGIWGGMTPEDRAKILREFPRVSA